MLAGAGANLQHMAACKSGAQYFENRALIVLAGLGKGNGEEAFMWMWSETVFISFSALSSSGGRRSELGSRHALRD